VLPDDIDPRELDPEIRAELRSLHGGVADAVARRLVASGHLLDFDPETALAHAFVARRLASRLASVREAVGIAAYHAGEWSTAIAELRAYHRIAGRQTHLAVIADCERALGRPERAIDVYRAAESAKLEPDEAAELLIVAAGARGDLGQHDAAVAMLQVPELTDGETPWGARLRYAFADALLAAGRGEEAREWFARAAEIDDELVTDAAERLLELDGVVIEGDDEPDAEPAGEEVAAPAAEADEQDPGEQDPGEQDPGEQDPGEQDDERDDAGRPDGDAG